MSLKILLADDSLTAQNMGKKILSDAGYEVVAVSNGAAALKKINAGQFDLLLLDVVMPGYTGPEVCAKARDLKGYAKTPIVFTIGKMELGTFKAEDAPKLKADGVIIKPFEATDLITTVQKITALSAPVPKKVIPSVPPEAEKTAKITPITEETDQSFAEWSAGASEHREEGEDHAHVQMPAAEAAATAAFDAAAAAPAFDVAEPVSAFAAEPAPTFDLGAPAYDTAVEAAPADLSTITPSLETPAADEAPTFEALSVSGFESSPVSALETPIPLEPTPSIPLEPAPPTAASMASELELTPEPVQLGHVKIAPGFEATAHDAVNVHVETAPELEIPSMHDRTLVAPDPNFQSDRTTMVEEFATRFSDAGAEIPVGVVSAEPEAAAAVLAPNFGDTAKISPWVSEPAAVREPEPAHEAGPVDFTPPESPGLHLGLDEFAAEIESAPLAPPEPEPPAIEIEPVVELVPEPEPEPASSMAAELETAIISADVTEHAAKVEEVTAPATLEASLEQSLQPQPEPTVSAIIEPSEDAEPAPKKPAGDLEFAQALEAAISNAPEAPAEPHHEQAAAAAASAGPAHEAVVAAAAETGKLTALPELEGIDPKIIATAIERVLANAKSQILEEVLRELKK